MDAGLFTKMLSDKSVTDLKKLKYKYPQVISQSLSAC